MYARITRFAASPQAIDQLVQATKRLLVPQFQRLQGYRGGLVFADREKGEMVGVGFWRELEDVEESAGALEAAFGTGLLVGEQLRVISQETFEVLHEIPPPAAEESAATSDSQPSDAPPHDAPPRGE